MALRKSVCGVIVSALALSAWCVDLRAQPVLERAFIFGSRNLMCETPNEPGTQYEVVLQVAGNPQSVAYDPMKGYGYEVLYDPTGINLPPPIHSGRGGWEIYGPFDDSPNDRNKFSDTCPEEIYDSFIGAKNFLQNCDEFVVGNREDPCSVAIPPDGIIFRVDVPNGFYRFVAAVGDADNPHAHRILAEDGGEGPPEEIGPNHVVLVHNFDQSQQTIGQADPVRLGEGVYARVGFDDKLPPAGDGVFPDPQFVNMDSEGFETPCPPNSPVLEVTQGYIRIHQLQGNSNPGPGAGGGQDRNGGDMVLLELWRVDSPDIPPDLPAVTATRSFPSIVAADGCRAPGEEVEVSIELSDVPGATTVVEHYPEGWTVTDAGGGTVDEANNTITFQVDADTTIEYTIQTPPICSPGSFRATITPDGGCEVELTANLCCTPGECELRDTGAPRDMLIIGPIDVGENTNTTGGCDHGGRLGTCDYFTDGTTGETNVLVEEGDELAPDWAGGAACGVGVAIAPNFAINPDGAAGLLQVWRATTDPFGLINYNLPENIGDPLDDYIVYSLVYLENTTGDCLDVVLEVGSDDAVKMFVNGSLVHLNAVCRGVPGYGAGDMVPVTLPPGKSVVLIGVMERGGGTGVRLVIRDRNPDGTAGLPIIDGRVLTSCIPPDAYPPSPPTVVRTISPETVTIPGNASATVTLTASGVTSPTTVVETIPAYLTVTDAGGGTLDAMNNTLTFNIDADGSVSYTVEVQGDCPDASAPIVGSVSSEGTCPGPVTGASVVGCVQNFCAVENPQPAELVGAFIFGSRDLQCPVFNKPDENYTVVLQVAGDPTSVLYTPDKGYGYEQLYDPAGIDLPFPPHSARGGWEIYGPFDDSPNGRDEFDNVCFEEIYDSFIGAKNWLAGQLSCTAAINDPPDPNVPCSEGNVAPIDPDGIIFRVDVPNGRYRFVAAFGDADNHHAHRIIAEDGGEGPPTELGPNHVVLVHNHDQAQYNIGDTRTEPNTGDGVFARVGFDGRIPPLGNGVSPEPKFVSMDENGMPTDPGPDGVYGTNDDECPSSPVLEVTQGYIRIHQLQANSNDGPGGARDPNGGDMVVLELWRLTEEVPEEICDNGTDDDGDGLADCDDDDCSAEPACLGVRFVRGDADANGTIQLTDAIRILGFLFQGAAALQCDDAGDADDNGELQITDGIRILQWLFTGGAPPAPPGPSAADYVAGDCGTDPTADALDCAQPAAKCGGA